MISIIIYLFLLLSLCVLYFLKKDKLILKWFDYSTIPLIILVSNFISLVDEYNFFYQFLLAISAILMTTIPMLFSRKRLASSGKLTCTTCKEKLPKLNNVKLMDKRFYNGKSCKKCMSQRAYRNY